MSRLGNRELGGDWYGGQFMVDWFTQEGNVGGEGIAQGRKSMCWLYGVFGML